MKSENRTIYLDHASATPVNQEVVSAMLPFWSVDYSNPNALHKGGIKAENAVLAAREQVAKVLQAHADEIIFTSGGTESDNLALLGVVDAYKQTDAYTNENIKPHIIVSAIEHSAILETAKALEKQNVDVSYISVDEKGIINLEELKENLRKETILVSVMYANNEIGTIQPIREIAKTIRHFKKHVHNISSLVHKPTYPYFHTDAVQAVQYMSVEVEKLGVDLLSLNASKIYGPKGIGALYLKRGANITPIMHGGDQEKGIRPGTLPTSLIVGLGKAIEIADMMCESENERLSKLQLYFIDELRKHFPNIEINGSLEERLPNNVHIGLPGFDSELVLLELDAKGVQASAKSACKSHDPLASYVIMEIRKGTEPETLDKTAFIRFSMGRTTDMKDLDHTVNSLKQIVEKYKRFT